MRTALALLAPVAALALTAGCARTPAVPAIPGGGAKGNTTPVEATPAERKAQSYRVGERMAGNWIDTGAAPSPDRSEATRALSSGAAPPTAMEPESARPMAGGGMAAADMPAAGKSVATKSASATNGAPMRSDDRALPAAPSQELAPRPRPQAQQEALQAGEVDDNRLFEKYLAYAKSASAGDEVHRFDASERYRINVVDASGIPVSDAKVWVTARTASQNGGASAPLFRARTAANGQALFFPAALTSTGVEVPDALLVTAERGQTVATANLERSTDGGQCTVRLAGAPGRDGMTLDLLFLVDTTGSMSEEISRVRDTIHTVSAEIKALPARPKLRLGMVLYRDHGDEYVTRRKPFTTDVDAFHAALREVRADGGGDEPEDMNAGLQQAVEAMDWSPENAVRMMFVIADAPPHLDYQEEYDYFLAARRAAEKGIKVIGVSTMGTNDIGEFVFRQLALLTQGRFVFVTRGGEAGLTPHHVDRQDFTVQRLDRLIVRMVSEELASLGKPAADEPIVSVKQVGSAVRRTQ